MRISLLKIPPHQLRTRKQSPQKRNASQSALNAQNTAHFLGATIGASLRQPNAAPNSVTCDNTLFILQIAHEIVFTCFQIAHLTVYSTRAQEYCGCCSAAYVTSSGHLPHLAYFAATDRRRFTQLIWNDRIRFNLNVRRVIESTVQLLVWLRATVLIECITGSSGRHLRKW